jgi:hydrogenase expression/formation protein HypE
MLRRMAVPLDFSSACPLPLRQYPQVVLAHGGGGRLMHDLLANLFLPAFRNRHLAAAHDASVVVPGSERVAFTTDSYVVKPLFFPGGDIGSLAVHGTVNDLAMSGARPRWLSAGFILEEGLPMETLWRVVASMQAAAERCGVQIITGDTKVVDRGRGDGLFINTAGLGVVEHALEICPQAIRPGDRVIVSGDLARHGMAIMTVREGLQFESAITSDSGPVHEAVQALLSAGVAVHCLRDLTRGGLAAALNELASAARVRFAVEEPAIPVREDVHAACEILGLDPLHVACEGRFIAVVPPAETDQALAALRGCEQAPAPTVIGEVTAAEAPLVVLRSRIGAQRILDLPSGELLPRIC